MKWKTRVTELLGCKYPILQGAFGGFGNWQFAAAVTKAGAYGVLTASTSRTPEGLREDIKKLREATAGADGSFGVNLTLIGSRSLADMLEVCIEERVSVETAAYKPDALAPRIKEAGLIWVHKAARVRDALHAERLGADAVIVVGLEGTGFKNPEQLPTMTATIQGTRQIKVPFIASGGIGDGRGFLGALGMGADGIMMGTAFMATKECPLKESAKLAMVEATPDNPELRRRVLGSADSKALEEVRSLRGKVPEDEWLQMLERVNLKDLDWGDTDGSAAGFLDPGLRMVSFAVGVIDSIPTVKELIDNIIRDAEEILDSWHFLKTR